MKYALFNGIDLYQEGGFSTSPAIFDTISDAKTFQAKSYGCIGWYRVIEVSIDGVLSA